MKVILQIIWVVITLTSVQAQNGEGLYDRNGFLQYNTEYQIEKEALDMWLKYEDYILWQISSDFQYADIALDAGLSGTSFLQFTISKTGYTEIEKIQTIGGGLEELVILSFKTHGLFELLKPELSEFLVYYLTIEFKLDNLQTEKEKTGKLILRDSFYPYIQKD